MEEQLLEPKEPQGTPPVTEQPRNKLSKREVGLIVAVILAILGAGIFAWWTGRTKQARISSFADCIAAGNEVMDSKPEQCRANDQTFYNITTFEDCKAAGFPIQESYPERCAAYGEAWTNPDQIDAQPSGDEEALYDTSQYDRESEHITEIDGEFGLELKAATDLDALPESTPATFKDFIRPKLASDYRDEYGCKRLYSVRRVSAVNVAGAVSFPEGTEKCGSGAVIMWYLADGQWHEYGAQGISLCSELAQTKIYGEFEPVCIERAGGGPVPNPNGSIDDVL